MSYATVAVLDINCSFWEIKTYTWDKHPSSSGGLPIGYMGLIFSSSALHMARRSVIPIINVPTTIYYLINNNNKKAVRMEARGQKQEARNQKHSVRWYWDSAKKVSVGLSF